MDLALPLSLALLLVPTPRTVHLHAWATPRRLSIPRQRACVVTQYELPQPVLLLLALLLVVPLMLVT